jgi:hypothetical protein
MAYDVKVLMHRQLRLFGARNLCYVEDFSDVRDWRALKEPLRFHARMGTMLCFIIRRGIAL